MTKLTIAAATVVLALTGSAFGTIAYDQNVTPDVIFGSGNANGAFTVDRSGGVELGLRAKLRHNASGAAENTFNSNGDGTYTFNPGVAPTKSFPTGEWSYEWSINTDYLGATGKKLSDFTYELKMTSTTGAALPAFDPIFNGGDHSMGTNATGNGAGVEATSVAEYSAFITANNVAQNSWKPQWEGATGYDPTIPGQYYYTLTAFDINGAVASTSITVVTGQAVPVPGAGLAGLGLIGLIAAKRRRRLG